MLIHLPPEYALPCVNSWEFHGRALWTEASVATLFVQNGVNSDAGIAGEFDAVSCADRSVRLCGCVYSPSTSRLKFANHIFERAALRRTLRQCAAGSLMPVWAVMEATAPGVTPEAATTTGLAQRTGNLCRPLRAVPCR